MRGLIALDIYVGKGDKIKRKYIGNLTILYCEKGRSMLHCHNMTTDI